MKSNLNTISHEEIMTYHAVSVGGGLEPPKLCVNCRHFRRKGRLSQKAICRRVLSVDPIYGTPVDVYEKPIEEARHKDCQGRYFDQEYFL